MRRLGLLSVTAMLALAGAAAGCGGDDETTTTTGATGATGAQGGQVAGGVSTAGEFIDAPIPDQVEAAQALVSSDPACEGVSAKAGDDFQVGLAISAASASPDAPLAELVTAECEGG